jgi:hypothetical protein
MTLGDVLGAPDICFRNKYFKILLRIQFSAVQQQSAAATACFKKIEYNAVAQVQLIF